jgi:hypothetical protein
VNETRGILSIDVTDTIVGWVCRKRLLVHDTPDGCLELVRIGNASIIEEDKGINQACCFTHQCQNKAHLSLQNPKPL